MSHACSCLCFHGQEDKLESSEALGDLLRAAGDRDAALNCYRSANVPTKVIEGKIASPRA